MWSGKPNQRLVEQVAGLAPGRALDVGCGEGADVVWLAKQGWEVTGVDVSQVALDRAAQHAADEGVADRTAWLRVDLVGARDRGRPLPGGMDLVTSHYMHAPQDVFDATYAAMAAAVRPGGTLLVVGHHPDDAAHRAPQRAAHPPALHASNGWSRRSTRPTGTSRWPRRSRARRPATTASP